MKPVMSVLIIALASSALAGDLPRKSPNDARVRYVTYKADDVVVVNVRRGVVTRITLEGDEKITASGSGFAAQCDKDELEWCIRADRDTNQIWVKPRDRATHNNLELATNKRDYSFRFKVLRDSRAGVEGADEMYRVIFQYPVPKTPFPIGLYNSQLAPAIDDKASIAARLSEAPVLRNTHYSMETLGDGARIAPSLVFDDGRFTYMQFPNNREIPAPFAIGADNQETRLNFHADGDFMVIHRLAPRYVLRLGDAVVGIWNEAYDSDGIATPRGTVAANVQREVRRANDE